MSKPSKISDLKLTTLVIDTENKSEPAESSKEIASEKDYKTSFPLISQHNIQNLPNNGEYIRSAMGNSVLSFTNILVDVPSKMDLVLKGKTFQYIETISSLGEQIKNYGASELLMALFAANDFTNIRRLLLGLAKNDGIEPGNDVDEEQILINQFKKSIEEIRSDKREKSLDFGTEVMIQDFPSSFFPFVNSDLRELMLKAYPQGEYVKYMIMAPFNLPFESNNIVERSSAILNFMNSTDYSSECSLMKKGERSSTNLLDIFLNQFLLKGFADNDPKVEDIENCKSIISQLIDKEYGQTRTPEEKANREATIRKIIKKTEDSNEEEVIIKGFGNFLKTAFVIEEEKEYSQIRSQLNRATSPASRVTSPRSQSKKETKELSVSKIEPLPSPSSGIGFFRGSQKNSIIRGSQNSVLSLHSQDNVESTNRSISPSKSTNWLKRRGSQASVLSTFSQKSDINSESETSKIAPSRISSIPSTANFHLVGKNSDDSGSDYASEDDNVEFNEGIFDLSLLTPQNAAEKVNDERLLNRALKLGLDDKIILELLKHHNFATEFDNLTEKQKGRSTLQLLVEKGYPLYIFEKALAQDLEQNTNPDHRLINFRHGSTTNNLFAATIRNGYISFAKLLLQQEIKLYGIDKAKFESFELRDKTESLGKSLRPKLKNEISVGLFIQSWLSDENRNDHQQVLKLAQYYGYEKFAQKIQELNPETKDSTSRLPITSEEMEELFKKYSVPNYSRKNPDILDSLSEINKIENQELLKLSENKLKYLIAAEDNKYEFKAGLEKKEKTESKKDKDKSDEQFIMARATKIAAKIKEIKEFEKLIADYEKFKKFNLQKNLEKLISEDSKLEKHINNLNKVNVTDRAKKLSDLETYLNKHPELKAKIDTECNKHPNVKESKTHDNLLFVLNDLKQKRHYFEENKIPEQKIKKATAEKDQAIQELVIQTKGEWEFGNKAISKIKNEIDALPQEVYFRDKDKLAVKKEIEVSLSNLLQAQKIKNALKDSLKTSSDGNYEFYNEDMIIAATKAAQGFGEKDNTQIIEAITLNLTGDLRQSIFNKIKKDKVLIPVVSGYHFILVQMEKSLEEPNKFKITCIDPQGNSEKYKAELLEFFGDKIAGEIKFSSTKIQTNLDAETNHHCGPYITSLAEGLAQDLIRLNENSRLEIRANSENAFVEIPDLTSPQSQQLGFDIRKSHFNQSQNSETNINTVKHLQCVVLGKGEFFTEDKTSTEQKAETKEIFSNNIVTEETLQKELKNFTRRKQLIKNWKYDTNEVQKLKDKESPRVNLKDNELLSDFKELSKKAPSTQRITDKSYHDLLEKNKKLKSFIKKELGIKRIADNPNNILLIKQYVANVVLYHELNLEIQGTIDSLNARKSQNRGSVMQSSPSREEEDGRDVRTSPSISPTPSSSSPIKELKIVR